MNATAAIVEGKMVPIGKTHSAPVEKFTAQAGLNLFHEFEEAYDRAAGDVARIYHAFLRQTVGAGAPIEEIERATKAIIESTKVKGTDKEGKEARVDGPHTPLARKFVSHVRAMVGAVLFAGIKPDEILATTNTEKIYNLSRKALAESSINWKGRADAEIAQEQSKKALVRAGKKIAEERGFTIDPLSMTPEQFAEFREAATERMQAEQAQARLKQFEKRAKGLVSKLVEEYGPDDAETFLKRSLEMLGTGEYLTK